MIPDLIDSDAINIIDSRQFFVLLYDFGEYVKIHSDKLQDYFYKSI